MDEQFFFLYHLNRSRSEFLEYPINERRYLIAKFIDQKEKEHEHIEKAKNKK
jgi:hypothetical protein